MLDILIAADYLFLEGFDELEDLVNQGLALTLLIDGRHLDSEILDLLKSHPAFRSGLLWVTAVKAGVRPYMQKGVADMEDKTAANALGCGHMDSLGLGLEALPESGERRAYVLLCSVSRDVEDGRR
jgi:hypothetical protein